MQAKAPWFSRLLLVVGLTLAAVAALPAGSGAVATTSNTTSTQVDDTAPSVQLWFKNPLGRKTGSTPTGEPVKDKPVIRVGQGREGVVPLGLRLQGSTQDQGEVVVTVGLPVGLSYVRSETSVHAAVDLSRQFVCTQAGTTVTCRLRTAADPTVPARILTDESMNLYLIVRAADGLIPVNTDTAAAAATADEPLPLGDITAAVTVPSVDGELAATVETQAQAISGFVPPQMVAAIDNLDFQATPRTFTLVARNLGGTPATTAGGVHAMTLGMILPKSAAGIQVRLWGDGWTCHRDSAQIFRCTSDRPVAVGARTADLKVAWQPLFTRRQLVRGRELTWRISGTAGWSTFSLLNGKRVPKSGTNCFSEPIRWTVDMLNPATLAATVSTPKGVAVMPGTTRTMQVGLANVGGASAETTGIRLRVPAGLTVSTKTPRWRCSGEGVTRCVYTPGTIASGARALLDLDVAAPLSAEPRQSTLTVTPLASNDYRSRGATVPLIVEKLGDPQVTPVLQYKRSGQTWTTWVDGGATAVQVGQALEYRAQLINRGSTPVPAGAVVRVTQTIGAGLTLVSTVPSGAGSCAAGKQVSCTLTTSAEVAPGSLVGTVTVTVRPSREAKLAGLGPLTASLQGTLGNEQVPVRLRVTQSTRTIRVSTRLVVVPDVGGTGRLELAAANLQRTSAIRDLTIATTLPAGLALTTAPAAPWDCSQRARVLTCRYVRDLNPRTQSTTARLVVTAGPKATRLLGDHVLAWRAVARLRSAGTIVTGRANLKVPVRGAIAIAAEAQPATLAATANRRALRSVVLNGSNSAGNGVSLDYRWVQRCTTVADVAAYGACPGGRPVRAVRIDSAGAATARAMIPAVTTRTRFVFQLTISDGSATKQRVVTVNAAAPQVLARHTQRLTGGVSAETAAQRKAARARQRAAERARAQASARSAASGLAAQRSGAAEAAATVANGPRIRLGGRALVSASASQTVQLTIVARAGSGARTIAWRQIAGPTTELRQAGSATATAVMPAERATVVYRVQVTDAKGQRRSAQVTVAVAAAAPSRATTPQYCSVVQLAGAGVDTPLALGSAASVTFGRISTPPPAIVSACSPRGSKAAATGRQSVSAVSFSGSTFTIGSLSIIHASGTIVPTGMEITSGSLVTPAAWRLPAIAIGSTPLSLLFAGGASQAPQLSGAVSVNSFGMLPLPAGWSGSTALTFAPAAGGTTSGTIAMTALDGRGGSATAEGTVTTTGTYSVTVAATNLITIGETPISLNGTASNASGTATTTITGAIGEPAQLVNGVELTALTATWTPTAAADAPAVTASATVAFSSGSEQPTALTARLGYTSTTDWLLTLTGAGDGVWSPLPGLNVAPSDFSGSIGETAGAYQWNVTANVSNWRVSSVLTLASTRLELANSCTATTVTCPAADLFMMVSTNAALKPPSGDAINASADAVFGIGGDSGFSLYASVADDIAIAPGLSFTKPALSVSYDLPADAVTPTTGAPTFAGATEGGWSINTYGGLNVPGLGNFSLVAANITSSGVSLGGYDADGISLGGSNNGSQAGSTFGFSTVPTTMSFDVPGFGSQDVDLVPGQIAVTGVFSSPQWFAKLTGTELPDAIGTIAFQPTTGYFSALITIPGDYTIPAGGSRMRVPTLNFGIENTAAGLIVSAGGTVELNVDQAGGGTQTAPTFSLQLSYDVTRNFVSGTFGFVAPTGWQDAFGSKGLTINEAMITLGVNLTPVPVPTPTIALYASGVLPPSITAAFGVPDGVPVAVGVNLSAQNPCLTVEVGSTTGTQQIFNVGRGALTATYFEFVVAPTGCSLGNVAGQSRVIPPGFSIAFDGAVFGTTVDVSAAISFNPTIFIANIEIGAFGIPGAHGAMTFQQTIISIELNDQTGINSVAFSGGFSMFGTTINVAGALSKDNNTGITTASLQVAQPQALDVAGFSLSNLSIAANVVYGPNQRDITISASGNMNIMGNVVNVESFNATIDNGVVEHVDTQIQASLRFGSAATADGTFNMSYTQSSSDFQLHAAVVLTTDTGFKVGTPTQPATLDISPQCAAFSGLIQFGSVFAATLQGSLIYQPGCTQTVMNADGEQVQGSPGDFSFAATNVAMGINGFGLTGDVRIGFVGGAAFANIGAVITLSPNSTSNQVSVAGSFSSNGDFSLAGEGSLAIAGFALDMNVSVESQAGDVNISGAADFNVGGTNLAFAGDFSMINGRPSTVLQASGRLVFEGFDLGDTTVVLSQTPTSAGMSAAISLNAGVAAMSGQLTFIASAGKPLFYVAATGKLQLGALGGVSLGAIFTNCSDASCRQAAPTTLTMKGGINVYGLSYSLPSFPISAGGSFDITAGVNGSSCTSPTDVAGTNWQACFSYTQYLRISSGAPYFSVTSVASARVQAQSWNPCQSWGQVGQIRGCIGICRISCRCFSSPVYGCVGGWGGWWTFANISSGIYFNASPFRLCVNVNGIKFSI